MLPPLDTGFDEAEVLCAARDRFWSGGYAATSVDDLVAATGLGKGSLYGAFGDKHQLYLRVFDEYCSRVVRIAHRALDGADAGAYQRLCTYVTDVVESAARDTARRGCLLTSWVAAAQREGQLDAAADPRQLATLLHAVQRGAGALAKAGWDPAALRGLAVTALASLPRSPAV